MRAIVIIVALLVAGCACVPKYEDPINLGMTKAQVIVELGKPQSVNKVQTKSGDEFDQWSYRVHTSHIKNLYFFGDTLLLIAHSYEKDYFRFNKP